MVRPAVAQERVELRPNGLVRITRGPPYWNSRVLRRQALGEEDDAQGRWVQDTA